MERPSAYMAAARSLQAREPPPVAGGGLGGRGRVSHQGRINAILVRCSIVFCLVGFFFGLVVYTNRIG